MVHRALQEAQQMAEEALVERDRLSNVVKTFEERSQKELSAESQSLKQQVRESERSLVEARLHIDAKAREVVEVLERAADLGEALKKERAARVAAVEEQKKLTRYLRTCLRDRAKAEEAASKASKALQQSKTQMESLTRRLEVLRSAKKRLDKKVAAAAPGANSHGEVGNAMTGVYDRLVEARARLRTLSTSNFIDNGGNGGRGHGSHQDFVKKDPTKAAVESALKTALVDKKWKEKLHDTEKREEAYRSAALAAEAEVQKVVKEKEELADKNRALSERLANFSKNEYSSKYKQDTESVAASVATTRTEKSRSSRETNSCSSRSEMRPCDWSHDSCKDDGTWAEVDFKTLRREVPEELSSADRSLKMSEERGAAPLTTPTAPPMSSNGTHEERHLSRDSKSAIVLGVKTAEADHNDIEADRKTTRTCTPRTARSNSLDTGERPVPFRSWCAARPRSASQDVQSNRRAPCSAHEQHETAMFNQLLTDSRRLRIDVLHALRNRPRHEGLRGNHVTSRPDTSLQAPAPDKGVENASTVDIDGCDRAKDAPIAPVPIAVLLRLCDRSARLAKGERENINTQVIEERKDTLRMGCGYGVLGVNRAQPTTDAEEPAQDDHLLPPGVSASLAQQVSEQIVILDASCVKLQTVGRRHHCESLISLNDHFHMSLLGEINTGSYQTFLHQRGATNLVHTLLRFMKIQIFGARIHFEDILPRVSASDLLGSWPPPAINALAINKI